MWREITCRRSEAGRRFFVTIQRVTGNTEAILLPQALFCPPSQVRVRPRATALINAGLRLRVDIDALGGTIRWTAPSRRVRFAGTVKQIMASGSAGLVVAR
jgi:hypothetical protein